MLRRIILVAAAIGAALAIALFMPAGSPAETADVNAPPASIRKISTSYAASGGQRPARAIDEVCHHEVTNA